MKNRRKKYSLKRKVWIEPEMMESKVFRSLSSKAMWVLLRFLQKITWEKRKMSGSATKLNIYEKGGLVFTYDEAIQFGISRSRFHYIIRELVEKGFIEIEHQGGCYGRDYSRYKLSDRWRTWGTPEFQTITKNRVLQAGLDVQSRKMAKLKKGTENRNP
jgi:hypothetical protein